MNARELLHKGCGESDGDGILALSGGEEEKREKEREKKKISCRFVLARNISSTWKQLTLS